MSDEYRIALRPDDRNEDPFTLAPLDDIVVKDVKMFRAEQMDPQTWWVCCYLDDERYITFYVSVKDGSLVWTATEFPNDVKYEHEL